MYHRDVLDSSSDDRENKNKVAGGKQKAGGVNSAEEEAKLPFDTRVEMLYKEVETYQLAPKLLWCMWGMVQSTNDKIPFGYWVSRVDVFL